MANYTKKVAKPEITTEETVIEKNEEKIVKEVKKSEPVKEYHGDDLISCRSITNGELLYVGKKSGTLYRWSAYGDTSEVEYQDILALKTSKSQFLYDPLFVIEDEGIIDNPKWADIKELYDAMISNDEIAEVLRMDNISFRKLLEALPVGFRKAIVTEVSTQIENGTFDSLQKIKIVDEICNTDLACLL